MNKNKHMYSPELMKELSEILKAYNIYYGYSNVGEAEEDFEEEPTAFFNYADSNVTKAERTQAFGFKALNAETLSKIGQEREQVPNFQFINDGGEIKKLKLFDVNKITIKETSVSNFKRDSLLGHQKTVEFAPKFIEETHKYEMVTPG